MHTSKYIGPIGRGQMLIVQLSGALEAMRQDGRLADLTVAGHAYRLIDSHKY